LPVSIFGNSKPHIDFRSEEIDLFIIMFRLKKEISYLFSPRKSSINITIYCC